MSIVNNQQIAQNSVDNGQNDGIIKSRADNRQIKGYPRFVDTYDKIVMFNREISNFDLSNKDDLKRYNNRLDQLVTEAKALPFIEELNREASVRTKKYGGFSNDAILKDNEQMLSSWRRNHERSLRDDKQVLKEKKVFMVTGHPAMFKSSIFVDKISKEHGAIVVDSDDVKKYSAYYDNGIGADAIHKNSKKIVDTIKSEFYTENGKHLGDNIVLPIVGDSGKKIVKQVQPFIDAGYEVHLINSYGENKRSVLNSLQRTIQDGRYIPLWILERYENKPNYAYDEAKKMLSERLKGGFYYEQYDTRTTSYGSIPKLKERTSGNMGLFWTL